jgi:DNA-binding NarL/FixJ family response regulator
MSVIPDLQYILATTEAGASAYVTKDNDLEALAELIRGVAGNNGEMTSDHAFWLSQDARPTRPQLSAQERRVLELYASGMTLDAVARRAGIAPGTAKEYLARVKRKYESVGRPILSRVDYSVRHREDRFGRESLEGMATRPEGQNNT